MELPIDLRRAILEEERQQWLAQRYRFEVAVRVNKRIGATTEELKPIVAQLERCERALDIFDEEIRTLKQEIDDGY